MGISLQEEIIESTVIQVMKSSYIDLKGFHFHVGSQLFDQQSYVKAISTAINLMEKLYTKCDFITEELNAAMVLISNGEPQVIVERETYQQLIKRESIPSHLINNNKSYNI